jgi:photosystem II stability/assembly factor-like uncharacterized protein
MVPRRLWVLRSLSMCLALTCFSAVLAQAEPRMSLVAPRVGWAVLNQSTGLGTGRDDHLFWTSDDGGVWKDITPPDPASREIAGVFFLDVSHGWVVLAVRGEEFIGPSNVSGFDLAATTDGGADWTVGHVTPPSAGYGWSGHSEIFFLDSNHGWLNLELALHDWAVGTLLATTDGGDTWNEVQGFNVHAGYGRIRFTDPQNGWVTGGPYGQEHVYATHDDGRNWNEVVLPPPSEISSHVSSMSQCAAPLFRDSRHGFLPVTYSGTNASGNDFKALALFSTADTGRTWRLESWVNLGEDRGILAFTAVDSQALAPKLSGHSGLTLMKLRPAGKHTETRATELPDVPSGTALLGLSFSDGTHGWASSSDGRLLSTADGGLAWKDITPSREKTGMVAPPEDRRRW